MALFLKDVEKIEQEVEEQPTGEMQRELMERN